MREYKPKIIDGKVSGTGWPIDGYILRLTSWEYDNHSCWHLFDWSEEVDRAVMETMYQTETDAGICLVGSLEEFTEKWKAEEWEPQGLFCIPLKNVMVVKVIREEEQ